MRDEGQLVGARKADFTDAYVRPDPRAYYAALRPLSYQIPQLAMPVVEAALAASGARTVLDVCCSYGINGALLRHDVTFEELAEHYADLAGLSPATVARADNGYFAARRHRRDTRVLGLDVSAPAVDYAVRTGLLDAGYAEDLETGPPSAGLAAALRDVELVVCTGGVGYIGAGTFGRLMDAVADPGGLWLTVFVLRVFPYDEIAALLERHGLVTERLPGTFRQRRFASPDEYEAANHEVRRRGLDPAGKEAEGWYHADCYLSRPAAGAVRLPVEELLARAAR